MSAKNSEFYSNRVILAPMVRAGRTALRNLVLEYGADLVYTEEIIDEKLLKTRRTVNDILQTIDYENDEDVVLRISKAEQSKCVLQVGSCSPENLVAVSKKVSDSVAAIDVNMGCPKSFSLSGGMGAALLSKPNLVKEMMTSLVSVSPIPVSAKIRVLPTTLEFAQMLEKCGISALAVHGRRRDERPTDSNRPEEIREVARALSIPVIASGESSGRGSALIKCYEDIAVSKEKCGTSSIMLARIGLQQPSIFRREGLLSMEDEISNFMDKACIFDENYTMTKYVVQRILGSRQSSDERGVSTVQAATMSEICKIWNKEDFYEQCSQKYNRLSHKRKFYKDENDLFQMEVTFSHKRLKAQPTGTPKCVLAKYCTDLRIGKPVYETAMSTSERRFTAVVSVDNKKFTSTIGQINKKMAEQVAALSALHGLGIREKLTGNWE